MPSICDGRELSFVENEGPMAYANSRKKQQMKVQVPMDSLV